MQMFAYMFLSMSSFIDIMRSINIHPYEIRCLSIVTSRPFALVLVVIYASDYIICHEIVDY